MLEDGTFFEDDIRKLEYKKEMEKIFKQSLCLSVNKLYYF